MDGHSLCLDTSALIAFLKGREPAATVVAQAVQKYRCAVTAVTVYEILFGIARAQREVGEEELLGGWMFFPWTGQPPVALLTFTTG
jgi:tRNA(fMet)-specific endonuclease VapC